MNIRPVSSAVSTFANQRTNKTNENPSFGVFKPRLSNPVAGFVRRHKKLNAGWDAAVDVVYRAQKGNADFNIAVRLHTDHPQGTIAFDVIDNYPPQQSERIKASVVAQNPHNPDELVKALNSASAEATRLATAKAEAAKKAAEEAAKKATEKAAQVAPENANVPEVKNMGKGRNKGKYRQPQVSA